MAVDKRSVKAAIDLTLRRAALRNQSVEGCGCRHFLQPTRLQPDPRVAAAVVSSLRPEVKLPKKAYI